MTVYKRGSVYHYAFSLRGRRYRGTTEQRTRSKAEMVEAQLKMEAKARRKMPASESITLRQFAATFLEWIKTVRSRKTQGVLDADTKRYYQNGWRLMGGSTLADCKLAEISRDAVESLEFPGGPSNGNCALRTLRRMLNRAHEIGLIARPDKFTLMREIERERTLSRKEEAKFLLVARQPLHDVALCILDAGMRPEEVFRMDWGNFRWDEQQYFIPSGKSPKSRRHVPISLRMGKALRVRWEDAGKPQSGWVFPCKVSKGGKAQSPTGHITTVEKAFLEARAQAGLSADVVLYSSRHTFGTRAYQGSGNLKAVMETMGHADVKTAMRYQHPELDVVREAIEKGTRTIQ